MCENCNSSASYHQWGIFVSLKETVLGLFFRVKGPMNVLFYKHPWYALLKACISGPKISRLCFLSRDGQKAR